MDEARIDPVQVPAIGVSFKTILDREGRREIVYQTYVERSTPTAELNALLDKFAVATDRQIAKAELQALSEEESELHKRIAKFTTAYAEMEVRSQARWEASNKQGAWNPDKLPPAEKQERTNLKNGLEQDRDRLMRARTRIAELTKLVNGNGSAGTTNSGAGDADSEMPRFRFAGGPEA